MSLQRLWCKVLLLKCLAGGVQTYAVPAGSGAIFEFYIPEEGVFPFVDRQAGLPPVRTRSIFCHGRYSGDGALNVAPKTFAGA